MTPPHRVNAHVVRIHHPGGPEVLTYDEVPLAPPGPGEARVRHTAIGVNHLDTYHRSGLYGLPSVPHGLGVEAAGVIEAVGEGVRPLGVGARVAYAGGPLPTPGGLHARALRRSGEGAHGRRRGPGGLRLGGTRHLSRLPRLPLATRHARVVRRRVRRARPVRPHGAGAEGKDGRTGGVASRVRGTRLRPYGALIRLPARRSRGCLVPCPSPLAPRRG
jgi:hypothetical protein